MEFSIPPLLLYAASWFTITGGVWALFERAETVANDETRAGISRWLRDLDPAGSVATWPSTFLEVFDRIFGIKHFSLKCFLRSSVASILSVLITTLILGALRTEGFTELVQSLDIGFFGALFIATAFFNFIPDYLSLLESRYVIRWMARKPSINRIFLLTAFDLVATAVIASLIFLTIGVVMVTPSGQKISIGFKDIMTDTLSLSSKYGPLQTVDIFFETDSGAVTEVRLHSPMPFAIWYYSAFFTSVWVWLYALSGTVVKLGEYLGIWIGRIRSLMDIERKPLRCMGLVSNFLITVLYLIMVFFR